MTNELQSNRFFFFFYNCYRFLRNSATTILIFIFSLLSSTEKPDTAVDKRPDGKPRLQLLTTATTITVQGEEAIVFSFPPLKFARNCENRQIRRRGDFRRLSGETSSTNNTWVPAFLFANCRKTGDDHKRAVAGKHYCFVVFLTRGRFRFQTVRFLRYGRLRERRRREFGRSSSCVRHGPAGPSVSAAAQNERNRPARGNARLWRVFSVSKRIFFYILSAAKNVTIFRSFFFAITFSR